jgi:twitching motility protein PilT
MRDKETVEAAINLAETGHLVFSTLHTSGSVQTLNRVVQFFNPDIQNQVRIRLADSLLGVLSQRLIQKADGAGRVGIFELMFVTPAIKNLIKSGDLIQVNNNIEMGSQE